MTAFFLPRFVKKWWRLYKTRDVHNVTMSQYVHLCAINFRICSLFCVYIIVVREENDGSFCRTQGLTIPGSSLLCALVFVTERPMQCDFFSLLPSGRRNLPIIVLSIIYSLLSVLLSRYRARVMIHLTYLHLLHSLLFNLSVHNTHSV